MDLLKHNYRSDFTRVCPIPKIYVHYRDVLTRVTQRKGQNLNILKNLKCIKQSPQKFDNIFVSSINTMKQFCLKIKWKKTIIH